MPSDRAGSGQGRESDDVAREVAMAVLIWLGSDGDDAKFADMERLAKEWKQMLLEGR